MKAEGDMTHDAYLFCFEVLITYMHLNIPEYSLAKFDCSPSVKETLTMLMRSLDSPFSFILFCEPLSLD